MKVYPQPLEIGEEEGFSPEKDIFGRAQLASGMSNLVNSVDDPLVIAFDGVWGSGKTTFLKMWAGELRKDGHPVIFFDAFENDYVEDAFAALARELIELAEEKAPQRSKVAKNIREKAVDLGALLARGTAKMGLKIAVRAATAGLASSEDFKGVSEVFTSEAEDVAEAYIEQLLDNPRRQKEVVTSFREALERLPSLLAPSLESGRQKPLIFIIDELDRCKPLFALSLLERVKHFMSVPNVHFVLGVHLKQIESSVKFSYGNDINAKAYLQKFINLTIFNTNPSEETRRTDLHKYADHLSGILLASGSRESPVEASAETIIRLVESEQMSFRTVERAFTVLAIAVSFTPKSHLQLGAIMGGLIMMKLLRPELFLKAKRGVISLEEAKAFLRFQPDKHRDNKMGWEEEWWTYLLANPLPDELRQFGNSLSFRYNFSERSDIVRYMANQVIDRLAPA